MKPDAQLLRVQPSADTPYPYPDPRSMPMEQQGEAASVLYEIHRLFRGRYLWAILLGVIGLVGGAYGGWKLAPDPTYQSTGLIRVAPVLPKILYSNEYNSMLPMFDEFVEYQTTLIRSPRVVNLAMTRDEWRNTGRGASDEAVAEFKKGLRTSRTGGNITVSFIDTDPDVAVAGVKSAVDAYYTVHGQQNITDEEERLSILENRRTSLNNELTSLRESILAVANEYGSDALESTHQYKQEELRKIESQLKEVQLALAQAAAREDESSEDDPLEPKAVEGMHAEDLAMYDPELRGYLDQRVALQEEIEQRERSLGPEHRRMEQLAFALEQMNERIERQAEKTRAAVLDGRASGLMEAESGAAYSIQHMRDREQQLRQLYDEAKAETEDLGRKALEIRRLKDEASVVDRQLSEVRQRIESLNVESAVSGRIEVIYDSSRTTEPYQDTRLEHAGLGGLGGMALGVGFILLLGFLDQRFHTPDDARHGLSQARLLGILPHLPDDLSKPDQADLASHSVHHIRALLQIGMDRNQGRVLTVTSPVAGDGKTSLCLSLGLSFSETEARTLLIDCDMVAGGLSSRARSIVRRKIGRVLEREGLITSGQLKEALLLAGRSGRRLGEVLVELGHVTADQLDGALDLQEADSLGLMDVMAGEPLDTCLAETGVPNLFILPVGSAEAAHASKLAPARLRQLIEEARRQFDIVLVDTGPLAGSLEASLVAAETDATVLVVSRGAQRAQVDRILGRLYTIGASIAGVVFNRADHQDFSKHALSSASAVSTSRKRPPESENGLNDDERSRLGPMARAVSSGNRSQHNGSTAHAETDSHRL